MLWLTMTNELCTTNILLYRRDVVQATVFCLDKASPLCFNPYRTNVENRVSS